MTDTPNAVDVQVGCRVRAIREMRGMSQGELGNAVGVTFQQMQKYEKATNRISASRLVQIATVLNVPVTEFFEASGTAGSLPLADFAVKDSAALLKAFAAIPTRSGRRIVLDFARELARTSADE